MIWSQSGNDSVLRTCLFDSDFVQKYWSMSAGYVLEAIIRMVAFLDFLPIHNDG